MTEKGQCETIKEKGKVKRDKWSTEIVQKMVRSMRQNVGTLVPAEETTQGGRAT